MRNFFCRQSRHLVEKIQYMTFIFQFNFHNFPKKEELTLSKLLTTTLLPLRLAFVNYILVILFIYLFFYSYIHPPT